MLSGARVGDDTMRAMTVERGVEKGMSFGLPVDDNEDETQN